MPRHLRRYDEAGDSHFWTISCRRRLTFFHDDGLKRIVADGLRVLQDRFGICLIGYVVMPEHVHVILYPHVRGNDDPIPVSMLLHAFKKHVGFHGKQRLREVWRVRGSLWSQPLNAWATAHKNEQTIWNVRGYGRVAHLLWRWGTDDPLFRAIRTFDVRLGERSHRVPHV